MSQSSPGEPTSANAHSLGDVAIGLLIEAGAVLASSLDLGTTMGQVAQLTVPQLADLCMEFAVSKKTSPLGLVTISQMLDTLHRALRRQPLGADLCTVCLVTMERTAQRARLKVALAGHPPPLLIDSDGLARPIGRPGTLLGVLDAPRFSETGAELRPGETLLLYTDGVPEAGRADAQLGEEGLIELCRRAPVLSLGDLLEHIEHVALEHAEGSLRDDLSLLGLRLSHFEPSHR